MAAPLLDATTSNEPKTRSYSGCYSCRAIKKKCLEDFDSDGKCGRCISRGVHCERTKPVRRPGGNPHGKRASNAGANGPSDDSASPSARPPKQPRTANGKRDAGQNGEPSTTPPSLDDLSTVALSMAASDPNSHGHHMYNYSMHLPIPPPIPSTSAVPYSAPSPAALALPTPPPILPPAPALSLPLPIQPPPPVLPATTTTTAAATGADATFPLSLPCNPWDQMFGFLESDPTATLTVDPALPHFDWASLTTGQDLQSPLVSETSARSPPAPKNRQAKLPTGMETILNGLASRSSPMTDATSPSLTYTPASTNAVADDSGDLELTDDMLLIYNALNAEFLNLMPIADRERAAKAWTDLARSTRLGRTAAAACVWLYLARSSRTVDPEERTHLLAQSDRYFQRAVAQLSDEVSLNSQIFALLDLFFVQADRTSIQSGNALLAIGELFIKQAHGPRPPLDLVNHSSASSLRMFAVLDILRCAVEKGRRTVFDLEGLPGCLRASSTTQTEGKDSDEADNNWQVIQWSGFPLELILCIAATVNLDCDRSVMTPEAVRAVADKIEEAIKTWNPARSQAAGYEDSLTYLQEAATKEMWRHATLLHFYRVVRQFGCLARPIQDSLYQILHIGQIRRPPPVTKPVTEPVFDFSRLWLRAFPWFMAATVATQPAERDLCRAGLKNYWSGSIIEENTKAAEQMWAEMDETGRDNDFRDVLQRAGLCAAFV